MILTKVLGLPQSIQINQRPDKKFRQGFMGVTAPAEGSENKKQVLVFAPKSGRAHALHGLKAGVSRGPARGVA